MHTSSPLQQKHESTIIHLSLHLELQLGIKPNLKCHVYTDFCKHAKL